MCRLFGLHTGAQPQTCSFWLLNAPDSLSRQSRQQPDGAGIGTFAPNGEPHLVRSSLAAYLDPEFARAAQSLTGTSFVAHVRFATEGVLSVANTHPFEQEGRMFAHNGVIRSLDVLDRELERRDVADVVLGSTDSERYFALLTSYLRETPKDVARALRHCLAWLAENLAVYCLNCVVATSHEVWAVRYPDTNPLWYLTGQRGTGSHPAESDVASVRLTSSFWTVQGLDPTINTVTVVASERMTEDSQWEMITPGWALHAGPGDAFEMINLELPAPSHQISHDDLGHAATAQGAE